jgi:signal transduction histidine kinase
LEDLSTGVLRDPELARIHRNGRFLQALINYILDLGELEMGTLQLKRASVNIIPLIRTTAKLLSEQLALKNQRLALNLTQETAYVFVDRHRIEQVLVNLLSAAHKFSPEGTEISLSLWNQADGKIRLSVRDSGPGIGPENINRMFQPYKRLGVSRRIIEMHGGKMWIDALTGGGANFIVELPVSGTQPRERRVEIVAENRVPDR